MKTVYPFVSTGVSLQGQEIYLRSSGDAERDVKTAKQLAAWVIAMYSPMSWAVENPIEDSTGGD